MAVMMRVNWRLAGNGAVPSGFSPALENKRASGDLRMNVF
jgi:hypothetical protein